VQVEYGDPTIIDKQELYSEHLRRQYREFQQMDGTECNPVVFIQKVEEMKQFIIFILLVAVLISWIYHYKVVEKQHVDYSREMETLEKKYFEKQKKMTLHYLL